MIYILLWGVIMEDSLIFVDNGFFKLDERFFEEKKKKKKLLAVKNENNI